MTLFLNIRCKIANAFDDIRHTQLLYELSGAQQTNHFFQHFLVNAPGSTMGAVFLFDRTVATQSEDILSVFSPLEPASPKHLDWNFVTDPKLLLGRNDSNNVGYLLTDYNIVFERQAIPATKGMN